MKKTYTCTNCGDQLPRKTTHMLCAACRKPLYLANRRETIKRIKTECSSPKIAAPARATPQKTAGITDAEQRRINLAVDERYAVQTQTRIYERGSADFQRVVSQIMAAVR